MKDLTKRIVALLMVLTLATGALTLTSCRSGAADQGEQDNCYGEDLPVVNE